MLAEVDSARARSVGAVQGANDAYHQAQQDLRTLQRGWGLGEKYGGRLEDFVGLGDFVGFGGFCGVWGILWGLGDL